MVPLKSTIAAILLLFFCVLESSAQQKIKFKHLTTDNGLPSDNINCVLKDKQGYV